ncbi:hypothetical protein K9M48_03255 [Candidatus Gracilibacteria bacterium]|nr:hypothetical protein [Candidatus Gracilibacteria bacterium]
MQISEKDLEQFDKISNFGEDFFYFNLGVGLQYEYASGNTRYSVPYLEMGKELWKAFNTELYELICNSSKKQSKERVQDIITGDIRNLAIGIVSTITSKYDVSIGIAIPVAALLIKKGISSYCSKKPIKSKKTVTEILSNKKTVFKKS